MAIEPDDFVMRDGFDGKYQIVRELSCGGVPYLPEVCSVLMQSMTGKAGSFYLPRGHLKIGSEGVPEDLVECARRETGEELLLDEVLQLTFNGFVDSLAERKDFEKTKERSYKRIMIFGFDATGTYPKEITLPDRRIIRALSFDEAKKYSDDGHRQVMASFEFYIKEVLGL